MLCVVCCFVFPVKKRVYICCNVAFPSGVRRETAPDDRSIIINIIPQTLRNERPAMSSLEKLVAMGFPEEMARSCLEAHGGDVSRACNVLLGVDETDDAGDQLAECEVRFTFFSLAAFSDFAQLLSPVSCLWEPSQPKANCNSLYSSSATVVQ